MNLTQFMLLSGEGGGSSGGGGSIGRLGIDGRFFVMDGQPFTIIESSDFSLYKRFLNGERSSVDAVLGQRESIGFNALRVWLLNQSVVPGGIHPDHYPDFYSGLPLFVRLCGEYGMVPELTVFTQTQTLMPSREDQQRHLDRTADAVRGLPAVLLEQVNEWDQHDNACFLDLHRPAGVLISRGSNGADSVPPSHDAPWDYELYHTNDLSEWQRKTGHNAMEFADQSGVPCMSNENTRYADRDASEAHAEDAAKGGTLLCAGAAYHSNAGKLSVLFDGAELAGAVAWVKGARSIPLEFQRGAYAHRTELEGPDCIRAYSRTLPDGRAQIIQIRP